MNIQFISGQLVAVLALDRKNIFNDSVNTQQFCVFYNITSQHVSAGSNHHQVFLNFKKYVHMR
jgi:hypothetical protein